MSRRIGFFPIMIASFAITVAFTIPYDAYAAKPAAPCSIGRAVTCTAPGNDLQRHDAGPHAPSDRTRR